MGPGLRRCDGCGCAGIRASQCGSWHWTLRRLRGTVLAGCLLCACLAVCPLSGSYRHAAHGFGGYVCGLLREPTTTAPDEVEFRDGMHGLLVWALATLLTAAFALATAQSLTRLAAPTGGPAGPATSVGGENIIAYDLDRLFRAERPMEGNVNYDRA